MLIKSLLSVNEGFEGKRSLLSVNEGFEGKRSPIDLQKTYPRNKYITPLLFPAFTDRPHSKPVQSPLFYVF